MKSDQAISSLRTLRTMLYDAYWPPFTPAFAFEPQRGAELCREAGADSVRFGSIGKYAFYPSKVYPPHPDLDGRDLLQEMLDTGVKVVCYIPVGHGVPRSWATALHPEWVCRDDDGSFVAPYNQEWHFGVEPLVCLCSFGDYGEKILQVVEEVLDHGISALYLDGPYQAWSAEDGLLQCHICQCPACQERYLRETGRQLPKNSDRARRDEYQLWKRQKLLELLRRIRAMTAARGVPLMMNRSAALMNGTTVELEMLKQVDCFLVESNRGGIEGASLAQVTGKMIWNYTNAHGCHPRFSTESFEAETLANGRRTLAMGGTPIVSYAGRFFTSDKHIGYVRTMFQEAEQAERLAPPMRYACVFFPNDERLNDVPRHGDSPITRVTDSLVAAGVPVMELAEAFLEDGALLNSFKVLYVGKDIAMTPSREALLESFVRQGGTLVFTGRIPPDFVGLEAATPSPRLARAFFNQRWCRERYDTYLCLREGEGVGELLPQTESVLMRPRAGAQPAPECVAVSMIGDIHGDFTYDSVFRVRLDKGRIFVFDSSIEKLMAKGFVELDRAIRHLVADGQPLPFEIVEADQPLTVSVRQDGSVVLTSTRPTRCVYLRNGIRGDVVVNGLTIP